ncbi:MAG: hypothetical protein ACHRHE_23635, partial [Tepidisphaerales bacterium]
VRVMDPAALVTFNGVVSGPGGLSKDGPGGLWLNTVNTYQGGTAIYNGVVTAAADSALGRADGPVSLLGGGLRVIGQTYTLTNRPFLLGNAGGIIDVAEAANTLQLAGATTGAGRA